MKIIGDRIVYYRNLKGISQKEFAEMLGLSIAAVSKIERNITAITLSRIHQIAQLLEIKSLELIGGVKSKEHTYLEEKIKELEEIITLQKKLIRLLENQAHKKP